MRRLRYRIVDVFTTEPLEGNALAVFPEASDLDGPTMQKIARELNLSETAFVVRPVDPRCAAGVRIFTPAKEMNFAGHPTIGASFVLLDERIVAADCEHLILEEKVGPVPIQVERTLPPMIWLKTPPIYWGTQHNPSLCAAVLGLEPAELLGPPPQLLDAGNPTLLVALKSNHAVDRAWLDLDGARRLRGGATEPFCVFVFAPTPQGAYSRMFAPEYGILEDPATGSSTGPLAAFMMRHGLATSDAGTRFISEQGTKMGRRSLVHVKLAGPGGVDGIYVGGNVAELASGSMELPDV
jgi:trans-2,3-dihydro-3-hydroxyanthranilate isomerase